MDGARFSSGLEGAKSARLFDWPIGGVAQQFPAAWGGGYLHVCRCRVPALSLQPFSSAWLVAAVQNPGPACTLQAVPAAGRHHLRASATSLLSGLAKVPLER